MLSVILLLIGCNHRSDADVRKKLLGTWVVERDFPNGGDFKSSTTFASDTSWVCQIVAHDSSNAILTFELEGTFQVKDGILIETTTKHSNTNAHVPFTDRARILRMDDRELVVSLEHRAGVHYPTNMAVFRKVSR